jgi:hypothetical protein
MGRLAPRCRDRCCKNHLDRSRLASSHLPRVRPLDGEIKILFTTATEGMTDEAAAKAPNAGAMFIADTAFTTMPAPPPRLDL